MAANPTSAPAPPDLSSLCLALTEHAPLPMATVEGATHIVRYVNPAFARMMEQPMEQLVGKTLSALLPGKDACVTLLNRVFRTGKSESHTEHQPAKTHSAFWSYTMWPVLADERHVGVMIQVNETAQFHEKTLAMNEALILGSVRQHELTGAADSWNARLQAEIGERKQAEKALHRAQALLTDRAGQLEGLVVKRTGELAATNRRLKASVTSTRKGKEEYQALFLASQLMQKKLRQLTRQILTAQEEERKEISRELHDEVVQTLVGINVELSALGTGSSVGVHHMRRKIAHTQRLVEHSVHAVHRFARGLRPAVLDDLGLIPALHAYSKNLAERKKLKIRMTAFGGVEALGGTERTVLFRVAQEALTNVARHAHATQVKMTLSEITGAIRMEISDNGQSFLVEKTLLAKNNKRLGLVGMRERVEMVGGSLTIESTPGKGTTVRAEIPFVPGKTKKMITTKQITVRPDGDRAPEPPARK